MFFTLTLGVSYFPFLACSCFSITTRYKARNKRDFSGKNTTFFEIVLRWRCFSLKVCALSGFQVIAEKLNDTGFLVFGLILDMACNAVYKPYILCMEMVYSPSVTLLAARTIGLTSVIPT